MIVVDPVFAAGFHGVRATSGCDLEGVDAGSWSGGAEAEDVVVRDVVRNGDECGLQVFFVVEGMRFAAGEFGDGFGGFYFERTAGGNERQRGETQRRSELADAVENLLAVVAFVFDVGALLLKHPCGGPGFLLSNFEASCLRAEFVLEKAKL